MPPHVIRYLRDKELITSIKDGISTIFDRGSVEEFQKKFNRDDYLSKREFDKKIEPYVTFKEKGFYISPVDIYVSGKKLITGSDEIPDEYRVEVKEFGTAQYITKKSLAKTIKWLDKQYEEKYPRPTMPEVQWADMQTDVKRSGYQLKKGITGLKGRRKIKCATVDRTKVKIENKDNTKKKRTRSSYDYEPVKPHKSGWSPKKRFLQFKAGYFKM